MKLYSHPVSPFARKARIIAHELDIQLEVIDVQARNDESLRRFNPLKQIPILVLDDGSSLFDSPVICEYLNHAGGGKFFPGMNLFRHTSGRWKALGLAALGDGIAAKPRSQPAPTRWSGSISPRIPPSARSRWPAPWAISISACPILIGKVPTPNCRPGMRVSANIRR